MKIVIVDDNESMRKVLRALCEGEGHEVIAEFGDGVGLLNYVADQRPDVVCLDFELPGLNGLELLVQMDVAVNQVDVVMITASDDPELKGHAADLGATGFIHKPFEQAQVIDELKEIVQTRAIAARAEATPEAVEPPPPPPPAESTPQAQVVTVVVPRSAVIVDDSGSIRLLLKGILGELGIKILGVASNGRDGIEMVKKTRPALVCLDIDMPGMTGLEALPVIRAASPQTKVVMITGNAGRSIVEASVAGGAKGYFLKPIRPGKVEEFMRKLFQM
jgi:DNA-binding NarL/FixJ family response regulator